MPRAAEDDAAEDLLIDQEAERLDETTKAQNAAAPRLAALASGVVELLKVPAPTEGAQATAREAMTRAVLLEIAVNANRLRQMVIDQQAKRNAIFAKRSTKRLVVQPITAKRMEERKAAIEAAREVESKVDGNS